MTAKKPPEEHLLSGRPSKYKEEYDELAFNYCLLGATDKQLAGYFDVDETTLNRWKEAHPKFRQSLKKGKAEADAVIVRSLYDRAQGYDVDDVKMSASGATVECKKHIPGDVTALIFWLKNRQPAQWRDKQHIEQTGDFNISYDNQDKDLA